MRLFMKIISIIVLILFLVSCIGIVYTDTKLLYVLLLMEGNLLLFTGLIAVGSYILQKNTTLSSYLLTTVSSVCLIALIVLGIMESESFVSSSLITLESSTFSLTDAITTFLFYVPITMTISFTAESAITLVVALLLFSSLIFSLIHLPDIKNTSGKILIKAVKIAFWAMIGLLIIHWFLVGIEASKLENPNALLFSLDLSTTAYKLLLNLLKLGVKIIMYAIPLIYISNYALDDDIVPLSDKAIELSEKILQQNVQNLYKNPLQANNDAVSSNPSKDVVISSASGTTDANVKIYQGEDTNAASSVVGDKPRNDIFTNPVSSTQPIPIVQAPVVRQSVVEATNTQMETKIMEEVNHPENK